MEKSKKDTFLCQILCQKKNEIILEKSERDGKEMKYKSKHFIRSWKSDRKKDFQEILPILSDFNTSTIW